MKNVYVKFNEKYYNEDYKDEAFTYGYDYNILCISNVVEVIFNKTYVKIIYKMSPRSKKRINWLIKLDNVKEITTN